MSFVNRLKFTKLSRSVNGTKDAGREGTAPSTRSDQRALARFIAILERISSDHFSGFFVFTILSPPTEEIGIVEPIVTVAIFSPFEARLEWTVRAKNPIDDQPPPPLSRVGDFRRERAECGRLG